MPDQLSFRVSRGARLLAGTSVLTVAALFASFLAAASASGSPTRLRPAPTPQHDPVVSGHLARPSAHRPTGPAIRAFRGSRPAWPSAMRTTVHLSTAPAGRSRSAGFWLARRVGFEPPAPPPAQVRAGRSPVWLAIAPSASQTTPAGLAAVRLRVFSRASTKAAGVPGVLMQLTRVSDAAATRRVELSLDYSRFRDAYGGDWAGRLQLVELTGCRSVTPAPTGCRLKPITFRNDLANDRLDATVPVSAPASASPATFLAATPSPAGSAGSFAATSLAPSSTWSAGGNTGDFTWSYPLRTPPALGGPAPALSLTYDSAMVDGQTATSNNQPSSAGEGFDLTTGYIERTYTPCADDMGGNANNTVATGDLCQGPSNATLELAGHSGELLQDASTPARWHLRGDDGSYIRYVTGASNGSHDGGYWVVTTTDGTQYWFGRDTNANQSAWTAPVYGNNPGEPCNASTFAASSCSQVWRWNLDHVVDPTGNTMDFYYTAETNEYAADDQSGSPVSYIRGGFLNKITYGTRTGSTGNPPMQVVFTSAARCVTTSCSTHDGTNWPDTPWDMQCTGSPCLIGTPTFWNTDALASIATQLYSGTGTAYNTVTNWTLTHTMPDPGDGTDPGLWLSSIVQTGQDGSPSIPLPPVTFAPLQLANRVDTQGGALPPMNWMRMATITTETGQQIQVTYNPSTCVAGTANMPDPNNLQNNAFTCYPVQWTPPGTSSQITDYFNKYTVAQVNVADLTTPGDPTTVTAYKYIGSPAWHYTDTTGVVPAKQRNYSVWRGYSGVETDTGTGADERSAVTTYFRGMNGDHLPDGTTRGVTMPAIDMNENGTTTDPADAPAVPDDDAFAGMVRETATSNGPGGAEVKAVVNNPFESAPTASTTVNGVTMAARFTGIQDTYTRTDLDGGRSPLTTSTHTVFDSMGEPISVQDNGNDAVTGDERCTLTSYARTMPADGSIWRVNFRYRVQTFATDCATAKAGGLSAPQVISDTLNYYDGATVASTPPTQGLVTRTDVLKDWVNSAPVYLTTATEAYDANGRVTSSTDVRGNTTTTAYTTNTGGQLATTTTTNALGWVSTQTVDPATGLTTQSVDPNGRVTTESYDALGRLISVWEPGRDSGSQSPSIQYAYQIRNNAPNTVATSHLTPSGGYLTTYQLYDGMLRPIQTQAPRADGSAGALITDAFYDSAGAAYQTNSSYLAAITPGTTYFVANEQNVPQRGVTTFDGAGRPVQQVAYNLNNSGISVPFATTTTAYGGDRVDLTPPAGGVATSTYTDVYGNTIALRQYHGPTPTPNTTGSYDTTTYSYNNKNQLVTVTDPAGNQWKTTYNVMGRVISATDPDSGTRTTTYDDAGDVTSVTDARGVTLNYTYDSIGRKTGEYNGAVNAADQLVGWVYDGLTNSRGQLTKTISYDGANASTMTVNGLTASYQPTSVTYSIPTAETGLNGNYTYLYTYAADGSPATTKIPAAGGLALETLTTGYSAIGQPSSLASSIPASTTLVPSVSYTGYGEPGVMTLQTNGGNQVYDAWTYDQSNRRLIEQAVTKQTTPTAVADTHYTYDASGNLLSADDTVSGDDQCFSYDYADRLTSAWTPASGDCTAAKSAAGLGGPAPYWDDWTFNAAGTRISQVAHDTANGVATTSYTVPAPGAAQPHAITATSTTNSSGPHSATYGYDADGNQTSRPGPNGPANQTLSYNALGQLASVGDNGTTTTYTYDGTGALLIERDGTGKTLYLPGQELRYTTATGTKTATRYYSFLGQTVAMRTASGVTWMMANRQNTVNLTINNATQAVAQHWLDPYGNPRSATSGTWPAADTRGYVDGTPSADGLTTLGARQYDPALGRFTSVDPVRPTAQPQRLDPYAYCADNPIGAEDPTGMSPNVNLPPPGQWTPEHGFEDNWYKDGYHYQYIDMTEYWCKSQTQCWGEVEERVMGVDGNYHYYWLDQNWNLLPVIMFPWGHFIWLNMTSRGYLSPEYWNSTAFVSDYLPSRDVTSFTKTPLGGGPPSSGGGSGGGSGGAGGAGGSPTNPPVNNKPDGPFAYEPPGQSGGSGSDVNPICGTFLGFLCPVGGAIAAAVDFAGGPENVLKYAVALGCILATEGGGTILCGTAANIVVGTAFNLFDAATAGGFDGPDPDQNWGNFVNFAVSETDTLVSAQFLPSDPFSQEVDLLIDGPQSNIDGSAANLLYGP
ncbi:MAG TPA: RHS repeat-associated core domain-containing protein [Streptosporangiaceae bacterium]|nr:RHS repeat-associated core domain-containing protein [Streptosporangiaceae bacterium]